MTGHLGPSLGALGTIPHRTRTHTHRCRHPGVCQLHDSADFGVWSDLPFGDAKGGTFVPSPSTRACETMQMAALEAW